MDAWNISTLIVLIVATVYFTLPSEGNEYFAACRPKCGVLEYQCDEGECTGAGNFSCCVRCGACVCRLGGCMANPHEKADGKCNILSMLHKCCISCPGEGDADKEEGKGQDGGDSSNER